MASKKDITFEEYKRNWGCHICNIKQTLKKAQEIHLAYLEEGQKNVVTSDGIAWRICEYGNHAVHQNCLMNPDNPFVCLLCETE